MTFFEVLIFARVAFTTKDGFVLGIAADFVEVENFRIGDTIS